LRRLDLPLKRASVRIALFEPEIAGNVGAVLRLGACLGTPVDLIEPLGFEWDDKRVRRTAMDYIDHVEVTRHAGFEPFRNSCRARLVLLTTKASVSAYEFSYRAEDILLFGKESAGVPAEVRSSCDSQIRIPIRAEVRSLNLATACTLALGEALRQTGQLPS